MEVLEKFIKWVVELYNTDKVAFVSLAISIVVGIYAWISKINQDKKDDERQKKQNEIAEETRSLDEDFKNFQVDFARYSLELENKSELIPYFHINHSKSLIYYDEQNNNKLVVKIYLTNVGRGTATNIGMLPLREVDYGMPPYFETDPLPSSKVTHSVYNYVSEYFAIPNGDISVETAEIEGTEKQEYFLKFKIGFNDVVGREYEQEFRFGYDNYLVKGINLDSTSYPPRLIKDIY